MLYGLGGGGGASDMGVVFAVNVATGAETVLFDFGYIVSGETPCPAMIFRNGMLYGTTTGGGVTGNGSVFSVDAATGAETDLYSFTNTPDGSFPQSAVIFVGDTIYGTTQVGGDTRSGAGTVFKLDPATGVETVLHSFDFNGHDGAAPNGLVQAGQTLFGTTEAGPEDFGVIFKIDPTSGKEHVLHDFVQADGVSPVAGLVYHGGVFYGVAPEGGPLSHGTVFAFDPKMKTLRVLYAFSGGKDGALPEAGLTYHDGALYGTVTQGGIVNGSCKDDSARDIGCGTVFRVDAVTGAYSVLHRFTGGSDGATPYAGLTFHAGVLYGTTYGGTGSSSFGTVFSVTP
jgi:uncharacterized repeat protein (TIGR03803 family)